MNSIRITKTMAENAAIKMADKAYNDKIKDIQKEINAKVEELVKKYIPSPIIACVNEYQTYFGTYDSASITTIKPNGKGWNCHEDYIFGNLSFKIPAHSSTLDVSKEDYWDVRKIFDKRNSMDYDRKVFRDKIVDALLSLKTLKKVQEQLPEAIKYIDIPEGSMLPAQIYTELNKLISKIK